MQFNYEISAAEQTVKDDEKGGQPEHIQRQIKLARQSSILSQLKMQKNVNNGRADPVAK